MKLAENEERALKQLREELLAKYPIIDIRLYGSKARGEGRQDSPEYLAVYLLLLDDVEPDRTFFRLFHVFLPRPLSFSGKILDRTKPNLSN